MFILVAILALYFLTVLGVERRRILFHMLWSAVLWGTAFTFVLSRFSHLIEKLHPK